MTAFEMCSSLICLRRLEIYFDKLLQNNDYTVSIALFEF